MTPYRVIKRRVDKYTDVYDIVIEVPTTRLDTVATCPNYPAAVNLAILLNEQVKSN
jgi:hypothetical protein